MSTYRQITYMVLDELKANTEDSFFQEEHILFLMDKYRVFLLNQRYKDIRKEIPDSNYQTICVNLERVHAMCGDPCTGADYLKSVEVIPNITTVGKQTITSMDFFQGNFTYTNNERFKYVGNNRFLANHIYGTIAPDNHLYLKSPNPQMYYLEKVKITGIFEDSVKAYDLECCKDECKDILDKEFPLEESLIPPLVELIMKEVSPHNYSPEDSENNASDDLSKLANYIARNLRDERYRQ